MIKNLFKALLLSALLVTPILAEKNKSVEMLSIQQTVIKMALREGVSKQDAIDAMLSKGAEVNLKYVGRQQVSKELQARGIDVRHLEIFQFCNPEDAAKMVEYDPVYAAYMPCQISLVEDKNGKFWLLTLNLDMMIKGRQLPDHIFKIALVTNTKMLTIMSAAATGEF